jgi:hypothetical protein
VRNSPTRIADMTSAIIHPNKARPAAVIHPKQVLRFSA